MVDARVLEGQQWVNSTYGSVPGYVSCLEDGITGWATMYSLTMGLQHELGISPLAAAFGPTTMTQLTLHGDITPSEANTNIINIVRYGLWAKGYTGGFQSGVMDTWAVNSISDLRLDTGLDGAVISITPKLFKALLNMDAYVLLSGGSGEVREVQQWLNARYVNKSTFFVIPCDGHFSRGVQQALMKGIQYEVGIPEAQANGNFGPGTKAGLEAHPVSIGSSGVFVRLFSAACVCNGPVGGAAASFKNDFDGDLADWVRAFQTFCALDVTGSGNYRTWAELLVSMGDADRPASGCDTSFTITPSRATALYNAGYRYVGRYLENAPGSSLNKRIQPGELQAIFAANLRVFPIWQMGARSLSDFSRSTGNDDASAALLRAWLEYGFDRGTVIYFAVDYDATDEEITSNIIPYFEGVQYVLATQGRRYLAGVYGSRNVCARVTAETYTAFSFVAGMSWAYSGNLGFPLPANWSFNQIKEFSFTTGGDAFALDNDVHRPRSDPGAAKVGTSDTPVDEVVQFIKDLYSLAQAYAIGDPNQLVMEYLRYPKYVDVYSGWTTLIGGVDEDWIEYAYSHADFERVYSYPDPSSGVTINLDHFGATANAVFLKGEGEGLTGANRGDFGGWGGDLSTLYGEWRANDASYASGYAFCIDRMAQINVTSSFSYGDLVEDVDGYLLGMACRESLGSPSLRFSELFENHMGSGHIGRFFNFYDQRYDADVDTVIAAARSLLTDVDGDDAVLAGLRQAAITQAGGAGAEIPYLLPGYKINPYLEGYAAVIETLADTT